MTDFEINASGNFAREQEKNARATDKVNQAFKELKKEADLLEKQQLKWLNAIATPLEKHNKQIAELNRLLEKGKLSAEEHARAVKHSQDQYEKTTAINKELAVQKRSVDDITTALAGQAAKWVSVAGAIGIATAAIRDYEALAERSRSTQAAAEDAFGELAQIASGPELDRLVASAYKMSKYTGSDETGLAEAARSVNVLANVGEMGSADLLGQLRGSRLIGPIDQLMERVGQIQMNSPKKLTPAQVTAMGFGAAGKSVKNFDPIMSAMPESVASGTAAGMTVEESVAAYGALASSLGPEKGNTAFKAIIKTAREKGKLIPGATMEQLLAANGEVKWTEEALPGVLAMKSPATLAAYHGMQKDVVDSQVDPEGYLLAKAAQTSSGDNPAARFSRAAQESRAQAAREKLAEIENGIDKERKKAIISKFRADMGPGLLTSAIATGASMLPLSSPWIAKLLETEGSSATTAAIEKQTDELTKRRPQAPPLQTANP